MLEIPNIMLVCKFEINWSTNKNLRVFTTYLGWTDGRPVFPYPPLRFAGAGDNNTFSHNSFVITSRMIEQKTHKYNLHGQIMIKSFPMYFCGVHVACFIVLCILHCLCFVLCLVTNFTCVPDLSLTFIETTNFNNETFLINLVSDGTERNTD